MPGSTRPTVTAEASAPSTAVSRPVGDSTLRAIERFLHHEARLLDDRRFAEWLELFTDDVHYWMPVRGDRSDEREGGGFAAPGELAFFDETRDSLARRVARIGTGLAWAEEPPSRTRHLITNVEAEETERLGEYRVSSYFIVYRTRLETKQDLFVGMRDDLVRQLDDEWRIARRTILLDQTVLSADNLSVFF
jgi:3-phenylpropionate/cinnamic acid dioxygenase small subunit